MKHKINKMKIKNIFENLKINNIFENKIKCKINKINMFLFISPVTPFILWLFQN